MPQNTRRYFDEAQDLARGPTPESYGSEFAALMREKIGNQFKHLVTPEKLGLMTLVGRPEAQYSHAGKNYSQGYLEDPKATKEMEEDLSGALKGYYYDPTGHFQVWNQKLPKGKRIFGIGRGADAPTYAHELRHEDVRDEDTNRMLDIVHSSTSLPAYKANIQKVFSYMVNFNRERIKNTSLADKEKEVLATFSPMMRGEVDSTQMGGWTKYRAGDMDNVINKNIEFNKAGAKGAFIGNEKLPDHIIEYRANLPFLNFVGRLGEYEPVKKAAGGAIENTTHYRKMI